MFDNNTIPAELYSFKDFLFKNRRNRITLLLAVAAIVIQFAVFKYFYPFASYIHGDSFYYLQAASENSDINYYMIGYSKLLRLLSVFTKSDTVIIAFQYLLIQISALFFLFTVIYFYKPHRLTQVVLLCFMIINPLFLHLANLISSDGFFLGLSLIWFTFLLWILHSPTKQLIIWQALILLIAFTTRYNALIYPFIASIVFFLSKISIKRKVIGIGMSFFLCGLFFLYTSHEYKQFTGIQQYTPFSGWQLTNNAMYAYRYVDKANRKPVPKKFKLLDSMICIYFDSTRDIKKHPQEAELASTVYMWSEGLPLFQYMNLKFVKDTAATKFKKWASMGPYYSNYGIFLIKQYPWHYVRYFLWPNTIKYFAPPTEFLSVYNSGKNSVTPLTKLWFKYKNQKLATRMKDSRITILDFYPIVSGVINMGMLLSILFYLILNGIRNNSQFHRGVLLGGAIWLLNAGFTITASSAALRYQCFPILITTTFTFLLVNWIAKTARLRSETKNKTAINEDKRKELSPELLPYKFRD